MKLIGQLWYLFDRSERIEGVILLCAMALGAVFEVVGVGLVVPFIALLREPQLALETPIIQPVLSALHIRDAQVLVIALGLALLALL